MKRQRPATLPTLFGRAKTRAQIRHPNNHGATGVEKQILKAPAPVEGANAVVERMRDNARAADQHRRLKRGPQGEEEE